MHDAVCDGNLAASMMPPHFQYGKDAKEAGKFLIRKIKAVRK